MEQDVGSDHRVGYGEPSGRPAEDAVPDAHLTAPARDRVNDARLSAAPAGTALDEPPPRGPVAPDRLHERRAPRTRPRADTDVSAHRSTRLVATLLFPFLVLIELPGVIARLTLAAGRRCRRALSSAGRRLRRLLAPAGRRLVKLLGSGARLLRLAVAAARSLARLAARLGSWIGGLLAPLLRALAVALRAIGRAIRVVARGIGWVVGRVGRAIRVVARGIGWVVGRVGRALAVAARAVGRVLAGAGRAIWWVALRIGRALAVALAAIGRVVRAIADAAGRVILRLAHGLGAAVSTLAALSAPLRRAIAAGLKAVSRGMRRSARAVGRAVARSLAPVGRLLGAVGRSAWDLLAAAGRPFRRAAARLAALIVATLRRLEGRLAAGANAGRLAHGAARRRARRLAHTSPEAPGPVLGTHDADGPGGAAAAAQLSPRPARHQPTGRVRDGVTFNVAVSQNAYLELGGEVVDAVVTVSTVVGHVIDDVTAPQMAEVILLDCSESMGHPAPKMTAARRATQVAVETLRDGVAFAIVRCTGEAEVVYPNGGGLALASPQTRAEAKAAAEALRPGGGTAMGRWLLQARDLFLAVPDAIHHALLLTDGRDEGETPADLAGAVDACTGEYQCDCRGVGTDWDVAELRHVAAGLLGSVDIIPDPAGMEADFRAVTQRAMNRVVDSVDLHIWTPRGAHVDYVRQITPSVEEMMAYESPVDPSTREYPTGAWGCEARQYHIRARVEPRHAGAEMLAARVRVVVGQTTRAQAKVLATWTDDPALSGHLDPVVARATGRAELATAIHRGLEARRRGDDSTATVLLGRAVQLAAETANRDIGVLLAKVVEVHDAATGTVTLRRRVTDLDEMVLDTRSTKTVRMDR